MKNEIQIVREVQKEITQKPTNSLNLKLTKIENKNTYNTDNSTHTTSYTQNNYNQGLFSTLFSMILLPFKWINQLIVWTFNKLNPKYREHKILNFKRKNRKKYLYKMNSIYDSYNDEIQ